MQIVEALQIAGRGLVVVTDVRLRDMAQLGGLPPVGGLVRFLTPDGLRIDSTVGSLELFSSPFNPNKPFAFAVQDGLEKAALPRATQITFVSDAA